MGQSLSFSAPTRNNRPHNPTAAPATGDSNYPQDEVLPTPRPRKESKSLSKFAKRASRLIRPSSSDIDALAAPSSSQPVHRRSRFSDFLSPSSAPPDTLQHSDELNTIPDSHLDTQPDVTTARSGSKGKERAVVQDMDNMPSSSNVSNGPVLENYPAFSDAPRSYTEPEGDEDLNNTTNNLASLTTGRPPTPIPTHDSVAPSPPPVNPHQFPPPGTLMVVQGVVHTTDSPPTPAPLSQPVPSLSIRDRISSSSRRTPSPRPRRGARTLSLPSTPGILPDSRDDPASMSTVETPPLTTDDPSAVDESLHSNSVDVLGALLSVATAATAAALVTGSTEPLFGQGSGVSPQDTVPGERQNRRGVWESLRDRVGRRREGARPSDTTTEATQNLLAEMANILMGRNEDGSPPSPPARPRMDGGSPGGQPTAAPEPPVLTSGFTLTPAPMASIPGLPPQESFDTFLGNLQADLRIALMASYASRRRSANFGQNEPRSSPITIPHPEPLPQPPLAPEVTERWPSPSHAAVTPIPLRDPPVSSEVTPNPTLTRPTEPGSPPIGALNWWRVYRFPPMLLQTPSPNEVAARAVARTPLIPEQANPSGSSLEATIPPPLTSPHTIVPVIIVGLRSVPTDHGDIPTPLPPAAPPSYPNSTDNGRILFPGSTSSSEQLEPAPTRSHDGPSAEEMRQGESARTMHANWQSRAARAISRLGRNRASLDSRPNPDSSNVAPVPLRTTSSYVIWVIGGYYPPDHPLVTGSENVFDSFGNMWDIADLLGQVKPPVATSDEIAKSGLEIIKASCLEKLSREGKIASSTTERCLVCLDEYDPDDNVRLMKCRHFFHKDCVDRWMQQGKNNCPACRSKGVRTAGDTGNDDTSNIGLSPAI